MTANRPKQIYTQEKAAHLVEVSIAVVSVSLLLGWQELILLNPLLKDEEEMAIMDPSEIVATPIPLEKVVSFVVFPVVINMMYWLVRAPRTLTSNLLWVAKLTLTTYGLFALCGNNMVQNWRHSLLSALFVGTLLNATSTGKITSNVAELLPFTDFSDPISAARLYGIILVTIPFQVFSVLDHGAQVQRWPLPILLGATYGFVTGTLVGLALPHVRNAIFPRRAD